jgi:hypothetical protein
MHGQIVPAALRRLVLAASKPKQIKPQQQSKKESEQQR